MTVAPDEPVSPPARTRHVKAAADRSAGAQHPEGLAVGRLLVGEGMEAVERKYRVKAAVLERERAHIPLPERDVLQSQPVRLFLRLRHHVRRVIEAGDLCLGQRLIERHGEDARPDRDLQQPPGKILRDAGQGFFLILAAHLLVHIPDQTAHQPARQRGAGHHAVVSVSSCVFIFPLFWPLRQPLFLS